MPDHESTQQNESEERIEVSNNLSYARAYLNSACALVRKCKDESDVDEREALLNGADVLIHRAGELAENAIRSLGFYGTFFFTAEEPVMEARSGAIAVQHQGTDHA